jgi:AraC-like DNA-binding protein
MPDFAPLPGRPGVRLLWAGVYQIDRTWDLPLRDPFWRLYRNRAAGAMITWPGGRLALSPGRLVLVPAWCGCRGSCQGSVEHFFLHFAPTGLPPGLDDRPFVLPPEPVRDALAELVCALPDGSPAWWMQAQALALAALAGPVAAWTGGRPEAAATPDDDRLLAILAHIEANLAHPLPVAALARRAGLGADRCARLFRSRHGVALAAYVRQRRVTAAAERLRAGDEPIADLAAACGFANRFHFTRVFTALMGVSPAAYRRQGRGWPTPTGPARRR